MELVAIFLICNRNYIDVIFYFKHVNSDMMLEDITGKSVLAIGVFSLTIRELVNHLMNKLEAKKIVVYSNEIQWVLTVPSTWGVDLKPMVRKSAEMVCIDFF